MHVRIWLLLGIVTATWVGCVGAPPDDDDNESEPYSCSTYTTPNGGVLLTCTDGTESLLSGGPDDVEQYGDTCAMTQLPNKKLKIECPDGSVSILDGTTDLTGGDCVFSQNDQGQFSINCGENTTIAVCGNGIVEAGEACDDGNNKNNDGCSSTCTLETSPPTSCGPGQHLEGGTCVSDTTTPPTCEGDRQWDGQNCVLNCEDDESEDGDMCAPDQNHCPGDTTLKDGVCVLECEAGFDPDYDHDVCIPPCELDEVWDGSECVIDCPTGQVAYEGLCIPTPNCQGDRIWNGTTCALNCPPGANKMGDYCFQAVTCQGISVGDGSKGSPYQICDAAGLQAIPDHDEAYYILTGDIDLANTSWKPLDEFKGQLNGENHIIANMHIEKNDDDEDEDVGLFERLSEESSVTSLRFLEPRLLAPQSVNVGTLAGTVEGTIHNVQIINGHISSHKQAGGLAGTALGAKISTIYVKNTRVEAVKSDVGGIVGIAENASILEYLFLDAGELTLTSTNDTEALGGVAGTLSTKSKVRYVTIEDTLIKQTAAVLGLGSVAGIAQDSGTSISNISAWATLQHDTGFSAQSIGGVVGKGTAISIQNVILCNIMLQQNGSNFQSYSPNSLLNKSWGRVLGVAQADTTIRNVFYCNSRGPKFSGTANQGAMPVSNADMGDISHFNGIGQLDFQNDWFMDENALPFAHPALQNMPH